MAFEYYSPRRTTIQVGDTGLVADTAMVHRAVNDLVAEMPGKVDKGDIVLSASDFASSSYPIQDAIAAAKAATTAATSSRGAVVLLPSRSVWETDNPIILPRTGSTPVNAIQLVGEGSRQTKVVGVTGGSLTSGRGVIEWEATTSRAWHQRISGLTIILPDVAGVHAIRYKRNATGTTLADFNLERMQVHLEDLLIEGSNDYHSSLIKLEGQVFFSKWSHVYGDCVRGATSLYDTAVFEVDGDLPSGGVDSDITGLSYSDIEGCIGNVRKGGRHQLIKGRAKNVRIVSGFTDGSEVEPGIDLRNSFNVLVESHNNEGRSASQVRFRDSAGITIDRVLPSSQDPIHPDWTASTAYATGAGVVIPGWRAASTGAAPANISWFKATTGGTSGGTQPTWPTTLGATVTDGGVTWTNMGPALQDALVFEGCSDVNVNLVSSSNKPEFNARGIKAARFTNCINANVTGAVPGDPSTEIAWVNTTGYGRVRGARANVYRTLGTDPFAAAATVTSPIFIPAERFTASVGTPVITTQGISVNSYIPAWSLDAAVDEFVRCVLDTPAGWTTATVEFLWFNPASGTGSVVFRSRLGFLHPNGTLTGGSSQDLTVTAPAINTPTRTTVGVTGATLATGGQILLEVGRRGTSGADTLANDANLIGVYLHKAS